MKRVRKTQVEKGPENPQVTFSDSGRDSHKHLRNKTHFAVMLELRHFISWIYILNNKETVSTNFKLTFQKFTTY